jgi:hypothetical protein
VSKIADEIISQLPKLVKEHYEKAAVRMADYIRQRMGQKTNSQKFSQIAPQPTSAALRVVTGKLYKSFVPRKEGNINDITYDNGRLRWEFGSSLIYAKIHEEGGFIKSKGKMEGYFWSVYKKTKNPYYKNLALGVKKRGGVNIPKRPYFNPAINYFMNDSKRGHEYIINNILKTVKRIWDGSGK